MFAIAIDMTLASLKEHHPRSSQQGYTDISVTLGRFGFRRIQWSVYAAPNEDLANLFRAIDALRALPWFGRSVKNIRAFRMEEGSDFTGVIRGET
jgi:virulence-associated protein VapD